jgi:hypothetical protein
MKKVWLVLVVCVAMVGCRTLPEPVAVRVERDSIYLSRVERDSVFVRDSVLIREKGDTVYRDRWRVEYRERVLRDTVYFGKSDTLIITKVVEVATPLSWWKRVKISAGGVAIAVLGVLAVLGVVKLKIKNLGL